MIDRVGRAKESGREPVAIVEALGKAEVPVPQPVVNGALQVPLIDLLECLGVVDEDVFLGEKVEIGAVRRKEDLRELALLAIGPLQRVGDGALGEVVAKERRLPDLPAIGTTRGDLYQQDGEAIERIDVEAAHAHVRAPLTQRDRPRALAAGEVEDLDRLEGRIDGVERLAIGRERQSDGDPDLDRHRVAHRHRRLVDDEDLLVVRPVVDRPVAARCLLRGGSRWRNEQECGTGEGPAQCARGAASDVRTQEVASHGKIRSILRQSCCAAAHLAVQSGAWLYKSGTWIGQKQVM